MSEAPLISQSLCQTDMGLMIDSLVIVFNSFSMWICGSSCNYRVQECRVCMELIPTVHANGQQSALCVCGLEK